MSYCARGQILTGGRALMLMWQTSAINAEEVEALASHARGVAECLLRTDNKGSVILCERGKAAKGVVETRLTPLLSAGRFGPEAGPWIFLVGIWTPADWREEFCAWYQYEHGPMLLECRDWSGFSLWKRPPSVAASSMCCIGWPIVQHWIHNNASAHARPPGFGD